jgi:hypothetical protein
LKEDGDKLLVEVTRTPYELSKLHVEARPPIVQVQNALSSLDTVMKFSPKTVSIPVL